MVQVDGVADVLTIEDALLEPVNLLQLADFSILLQLQHSLHCLEDPFIFLDSHVLELIHDRRLSEGFRPLRLIGRTNLPPIVVLLILPILWRLILPILWQFAFPLLLLFFILLLASVVLPPLILPYVSF